MNCPDCGARAVVFAVPSAYREYAPGDPAAICPECLALSSAAAAAADADADDDFEQIHTSFPTGEAAVPTALAVGLLDSLALNRAALTELVAAAESGGADPLLVFDRLDKSGAVQPSFDIGRRRHQLEQLLQ